MSDGWKVAATFIGVIGAAAIIFQLNQGTLFQSGVGGITTALGDAFSSPSGSAGNPISATTGSTSGPTNKTTHTQQYYNA